jgi:hypothetical protein
MMSTINVVANGALLGHIQTQVPGKSWHILDREGHSVAVINRQNPWIKILDRTLLRLPGAGTLLNVTRLLNLSEFILRIPLVRDLVPPIYIVQAELQVLLVARPRWGMWQLKLQSEIADQTVTLLRAGLAQISRQGA